MIRLRTTAALVKLGSIILIVVLCSGTAINLLTLHSEVDACDSYALVRTCNLQISAQQVQSHIHEQFYENLGQISDARVKFYGVVYGGLIGFTPTQIMAVTWDQQSTIELSSGVQGELVLVGQKLLNTTVNYFLGNRGMFIGAKTYGSVIYRNLHTGMDLILSISTKGISHEFQDSVGVDSKEMSVISGALSALGNELETMEKLLSTTQSSVKDRITEDASILVTNNPVVYSSYLGGTSSDSGNSITVDESNNVYITGMTESIDFPIRNGLSTSLLSYEAFISKFDASGTGLVYSTIIGGSEIDIGTSIEVDSSGNVFVGGKTTSDDFPLVHPYESSIPDGYYNGFLLKLNATGNGIVYSTYISGHGSMDSDSVVDIAIDGMSNVYAVGTTNSYSFPQVNQITGMTGGSQDAFVLKLNATGTGLCYSSIIGGSYGEEGWGIAVDDYSCAYVTGRTVSADFLLLDPIDDTYNGGSDCFVLKTSQNGSLLFSTYIGGGLLDIGQCIYLDNEGAVYIGGLTASIDFPLVDPFDFEATGEQEAFCLKIDSSLTAITYSTYLGGSGTEEIRSVTVDGYGNAYMVGSTNSTDFPTREPLYSTYGGGIADGFLAMINTTGDLVSSTYLGGGGEDIVFSIAQGLGNKLYITGQTGSSDFPLFRPFDDTYGGEGDSYIIGMYSSADHDQDGMPDWWESAYGLNPNLMDDMSDPDEDNLPNINEFFIGTLPHNNDTDSDAIPDGWEALNGLDPLTPDAILDYDEDGLTNYREYLAGSNPFEPDSDFDMYSDLWEVEHGFSPVNPEVPLMEVLVYNSGTITLLAIGIGLPLFALVLGVKHIRTRERKRAEGEAEQLKEALEELNGENHSGRPSE
jgi:hypothetical protein